MCQGIINRAIDNHTHKYNKMTACIYTLCSTKINSAAVCAMCMLSKALHRHLSALSARIQKSQHFKIKRSGPFSQIAIMHTIIIITSIQAGACPCFSACFASLKNYQSVIGEVVCFYVMYNEQSIHYQVCISSMKTEGITVIQ